MEAAGIQTSILMSESEVGEMSAVTLQNAGTSLKLGGVCPGNGEGGATKVPAGTTCASVIFVLGSSSFDRLSHDACEAIPDEAKAAHITTAVTQDSA